MQIVPLHWIENSTSCHGDITYNAIQKPPHQCGKFIIKKSNFVSIHLVMYKHLDLVSLGIHFYHM